MTGQSFVTTLLTKTAWLRHANSCIVVTKLCPCHTLDTLILAHHKLNNSYPNAYGLAPVMPPRFLIACDDVNVLLCF